MSERVIEFSWGPKQLKRKSDGKAGRNLCPWAKCRVGIGMGIGEH